MVDAGGRYTGRRTSTPPADGVRALALAAHRLELCEGLAEVVEVTATLGTELLSASTVVLCRIEQETCRVLTAFPPPTTPVQSRLALSTFRANERPALRMLIRERRSWVAHANPDSVPGADWGDEVERAQLAELGRSSGLASPIIVNGSVWGQIYATRPQAGPLFEVDDVATAEVLASLCGAAIARVDVEAQVRHLVADDPLTGLGNRRVADHAAEVALESGQEICIVMLDVDGLKRINDELGHDAGDDLLRSVADVLRRVSDDLAGSTAARLGGDEFCIVTSGVTRDVVNRTLSRTIKRYPLANGASISWGIASSADGRPELPRTLFRRADAAQYQAKRRRARAARSEAARIGSAAITPERLISAGVLAIVGAQTGAVTRLCALASAVTGALGGAAWTLLRDGDDGARAAVARGGLPTVVPGPARTVEISVEPWVIVVETTVGDDCWPPLHEALRLLMDLAVRGAS